MKIEKRYIKSFILTSCIYLCFVIATIFNFDSIKSLSKKEDEKVIALNHILLVKPEVTQSKKKSIKETKTIQKVKKKNIAHYNKKKVVKKAVVNKTNKPKIDNQITTKKQVLNKETKEDKIEPKIVKQKDYKQVYIENNLNKIVKLIHQNIKYPKRAKIMNIQGKVIVEFKFLSSGEIVEIRAIDGHKLLIKSSINAIKKASKLFPKVQKDIKIIVPVFYKLV